MSNSDFQCHDFLGQNAHWVSRFIALQLLQVKLPNNDVGNTYVIFFQDLPRRFIGKNAMDFVGKNAIDFVGKNPSLGNAYTTKNMQAIVSYRQYLQILQAKSMEKITEVLPTNLVVPLDTLQCTIKKI